MSLSWQFDILCSGWADTAVCWARDIIGQNGLELKLFNPVSRTKDAAAAAIVPDLN